MQLCSAEHWKITTNKLRRKFFLIWEFHPQLFVSLGTIVLMLLRLLLILAVYSGFRVSLLVHFLPSI